MQERRNGRHIILQPRHRSACGGNVPPTGAIAPSAVEYTPSPSSPLAMPAHAHCRLVSASIRRAHPRWQLQNTGSIIVSACASTASRASTAMRQRMCPKKYRSGPSAPCSPPRQQCHIMHVTKFPSQTRISRDLGRSNASRSHHLTSRQPRIGSIVPSVQWMATHGSRPSNKCVAYVMSHIYLAERIQISMRSCPQNAAPCYINGATECDTTIASFRLRICLRRI